LWFDGGDSLEASGLVLNNAFTLEFWIRLTTAGELLTIPELATFAVTSGTKQLVMTDTDGK
jgi:hypothetical protein